MAGRPRTTSHADRRPRRALLPDDDRLARDHYAALVIGTGFGGSVAAARLAQAGVDVGVVERGRRWPPGSFPRDLSRLDDGWLWPCDHGLYDARPLSDILAVSAAGYGGGSLVYANVAMRPPAAVFDHRWPAGWTRAELDPWFDLAATMLGIRPVPDVPGTGRPPTKTTRMHDAMGTLGLEDALVRPNVAVTFGEPGTQVRNRFGVTQGACRFLGECDIGCNLGAKNSLDLTYLAVAEQHGADVGTLTEAVHLTPLPGGGYRVRLREHTRTDAENAAWGPSRERDVTAASVFVCAGALGSTELLLRSRDEHGTLPDLPTSLGHGFSGNGDYLAFGRGTREPFEPQEGPTITTATLVRASGVGRDQWFVVEDGGYSRELARLVAGLTPGRLPAAVAQALRPGHRRLLAESRVAAEALERERAHTAVLLVMGRDGADGRISLRGRRRRLHVTWDVVRNDPLYAAEQAAVGDVVRALGGTPFAAPSWRLLRQPVTVHNLGGCRMSEDPSEGVTDPRGQVHGHPGLYVLDGATLPGATGANPSLTIAAVAERCIEDAIRRITGDPTWRAPEWPDVVPVPAPEDDAVQVALSRPALGPPPSPGVHFRERLRGTLALPGGGRARAEARIEVHVDDLRVFLADPVHAARLTGRVHVAGLTQRPTPTEGTLHLLAPSVGRARTMTYLLRFDVDGERWLVTGSKDVSLRRGNGPWRALTRLRAGLVRADAAEDLHLDGHLALGPVDLLRMLPTLRGDGGGTDETGPPALLRRSWALARFTAFFARTAADALLGARRPPTRAEIDLDRG